MVPRQSRGITDGFTSASFGSFNNCFSRINITVNSSGDNTIQAGGFIGLLQGGGSITNCYATGNVIVDASCSNTLPRHPRAGGLAGWNQGSTITNSFSTGQVTVMNSSTGYAYAGGLVGYNQGTITNCAVLGASVTALGMEKDAYNTIIRHAGRIWGYPDSGGIGSGNRALSTMFIGEDSYANRNNPKTRVAAAASDPDDRDGESFFSGAFLNTATWTSLGFTTANWNFTNVSGTGYPRLAWEK